jgi:hypothetical protein
MTKYRTSAATHQVISHHINRILTTQAPEKVQRMIPDATDTLLLTSQQQEIIGWEHWLKGRWSIKWATLINFDIKNNNSDIKYSGHVEMLGERLDETLLLHKSYLIIK